MFVCFLPQGYNAMSMDIPDKLTNHFNYLSEERDNHVLLLKGISRQFKVLYRWWSDLSKFNLTMVSLILSNRRRDRTENSWDNFITRIFGIMVIVCIQTHLNCPPPRLPSLLIAEQQCVHPNAMRHNDLVGASVVSAWCLAFVSMTSSF